MSLLLMAHQILAVDPVPQNAIIGGFCEWEQSRGRGNGERIVPMQEEQLGLQKLMYKAEGELDGLIDVRDSAKRQLEAHEAYKQNLTAQLEAQSKSQSEETTENDWIAPLKFGDGPDYKRYQLWTTMNRANNTVLEASGYAAGNRSTVEKAAKEIYDAEPRKWVMPTDNKKEFCNDLFEKYEGKIVQPFHEHNLEFGTLGPSTAPGCPGSLELETFLPLWALSKHHVRRADGCSGSCLEKCVQIADFIWYKGASLTTLVPKCHCNWIVDNYVKGAFQG